MRKLAFGSISFTVALVIASCFIKNIRADFAFSTALICASILIAILTNRKAKKTIIICFSASMALLWLGLFSSLTIQKAKECSGENRMITAVVTDYPVQYDDYARAAVRIDSGAPDLRAYLYDNSETSVLKGMKPGQRISLEAGLRSSDTRYGEDYDYYKSIGIYIIASAKSDISLLDKESAIFHFPEIIKHIISASVERLFPDDVFPFMKSLLLGDKSDFYKDTSLSTSMSRAGIMHVVAVSGMHISFLLGFLRLVFGSSKKHSLVYIIFIWAFVLITGASPSAQRAAFMQSVLLLAPAFNREEDSITSLFFALLVILLINPFAFSSVSLQLSFGAMAGIVLFSSRLNGFLAGVFPKVSSGALFRYVNGIIASSLSVMVFTVPITAYHFSSLQILSPLTNILVLWSVSLCFCGGFIAVLVGIVFLPAGKIIACAVAWIARYITGCAKLIASVPFSSLYFSLTSGTVLLIWICLVYLFVLLACFGRAKNPIRLFFPVVLSAASLCCVLYSSHEVNAGGKGIISVINVGQGQCISVFSGEDTLVIDCGSTGALSNAGETAGEYLQSCGRYKADCLVLTHLHEDHVNGVETFLEYIDTDRIIIPSLTPDEDGYLERILSAAEKKGVSVSFIDKDMELTFPSGMKADLFVPGFDTDKANEQCLFVITSLGDYDMIVSGDSGKDQELAFLDKHPVHDAELLIAGHHGSKYSSDEEFLTSTGCDTAVISTGYNTYGHPTFETLNILHSLGYDLYRTDMNGTVRIKVS